MSSFHQEKAIEEYDRDKARKRTTAAAKLMRSALQHIWESDDMRWITDSSGLFKCEKCNSSVNQDKLKIEHDDGCIQGIIAKAMVAWDKC